MIFEKILASHFYLELFLRFSAIFRLQIQPTELFIRELEAVKPSTTCKLLKQINMKTKISNNCVNYVKKSLYNENELENIELS